MASETSIQNILQSKDRWQTQMNLAIKPRNSKIFWIVYKKKADVSAWFSKITLGFEHSSLNVFKLPNWQKI